LSDLRVRWRAALGFHLLIQLLGAAVLVPLATWVARRLVLASGEPVVSNYDIAGFVLSPAGIAFVLLVAAVSIGLLLAEFAGHTWIAGHGLLRRPATVLGTVAFVLGRLPGILGLALLVFLRLGALALRFLGAVAAIWFTTLAGHDVNYYLAEQPPEWRRATLLAAVLAVAWLLLAAWRLARWLYAIPVLVFERADPVEALARSFEMSRGRLRQIVPPLVVWWVAITAAAIAITWVCRHFSDAGLDWAGIRLDRVLPLVAVYVAVSIAGGLLYGALSLAGHQFLVTRLYAEQRDPERLAAMAAAGLPEERSRSLASLGVALTLTLFALAVAAAWFLGSRLDLHEEPAITAHRGASAVAPENSMAAFRAAMEAGATYAELDVQRTRDGRIVVVHDGDLLRMGGDPRKVAGLTAAEIAAIDIGRRHQPPFPGEHPPTLEEVIAAVRGRMKLNVELKYNVPDPGLAPAVIELLRREDFLDEVVITSLDYAALRQVESIEPRLVTGHIVTAAVGDVLRTEADFLSLSSAQATTSLVRRAHRLGKQVHVWTVNQPEVMLRMIERGVDNVITDDPALLARVLRERGTLGTTQLLALRLRVLFAKPPREVTDPASVRPL
jgi:glycerophosphoryl diester phosphodiesterase